MSEPGRGKLARWASNVGHDSKRRRPGLRWAYEAVVATQTSLASVWASRSAAGAVDPGTVTLIVKTFERPQVLRRMLRSVRRVFAGPIIIADDSHAGFVSDDPLVRVLRLPFDSGIGAGRNALIDAVETDYLFMADDDMMLLPDFDLRRPLDYLAANPQVDLCGGRVIHLPLWRTADYSSAALLAYPGEPRVREGVLIDGLPVAYKVPNFYLARTERVRAVRYDDRLKRMDHNDFFTSAFGQLVCVVDPALVCLHAHSFFDPHYQAFRMDYRADLAYLAEKWGPLQHREPVIGTGPTAAQRAALHHAAVEVVSQDLGGRLVHHGTPADATVSLSVDEAHLGRFLATLRTLGWAGSARQLTHPLWGELRVRPGTPPAAVAASFATINGFADGDTWPEPVDRDRGDRAGFVEIDVLRWHPRAGWVDDGTTVVGAALPLGPVRRLEFPGDLIWEVVGPTGTAHEQVVAEVLASFTDAPAAAPDQIKDYLDRLVEQGLMERLPGSANQMTG